MQNALILMLMLSTDFWRAPELGDKIDRCLVDQKSRRCPSLAAGAEDDLPLLRQPRVLGFLLPLLDVAARQVQVHLHAHLVEKVADAEGTGAEGRGRRGDTAGGAWGGVEELEALLVLARGFLSCDLHVDVVIAVEEG